MTENARADFSRIDLGKIALDTVRWAASPRCLPSSAERVCPSTMPKPRSTVRILQLVLSQRSNIVHHREVGLVVLGTAGFNLGSMLIGLFLAYEVDA